jgi:hypothetical protein
LTFQKSFILSLLLLLLLLLYYYIQDVAVSADTQMPQQACEAEVQLFLLCSFFFFNETRSLLTKPCKSPPAPPLHSSLGSSSCPSPSQLPWLLPLPLPFTAPLALLPVSEELKQSRHGTAATLGEVLDSDSEHFTG